MKQGEYIKGGGAERWGKWMEQRVIEAMANGKKEEVLGNYVDNLARKLNEPAGEKQDLLQKEMEFTNECPVCMEMMVKPYRPMMLVPCGHNVCEVCLKRQQLFKCPMCKTSIKTTSPNFSLMSLITQFKQTRTKLVRQDIQKTNVIAKNTIDLLRIRCEILQKQKNEVKNSYAKQLRQTEVLQAVCKKLFEEKVRIKKRREELNEEEMLVDKYVEENEHKLKLSRTLAENLQDKLIVLEKSLQPLLIQKEKEELLEAERLIQNGI